MPGPTPRDYLTLKDLAQIKAETAKHIEDVLNRFSAQTGLCVERVEIEDLRGISSPPCYVIGLDVRL
jgi:hypothetical protein